MTRPTVDIRALPVVRRRTSLLEGQGQSRQVTAYLVVQLLGYETTLALLHLDELSGECASGFFALPKLRRPLLDPVFKLVVGAAKRASHALKGAVRTGRFRPGRQR